MYLINLLPVASLNKLFDPAALDNLQTPGWSMITAFSVLFMDCLLVTLYLNASLMWYWHTVGDCLSTGFPPHVTMGMALSAVVSQSGPLLSLSEESFKSQLSATPAGSLPGLAKNSAVHPLLNLKARVH